MQTIKAKEIFEVRAGLLLKGHTVKSFADKHGIRPGTALAIIHRHCGSTATNKTIQGPTTRRVLELLEQEINPT